MCNGILLTLGISFLSYFILLKVGNVTAFFVSCHGDICDIINTIPVWTKDLSFNEELYLKISISLDPCVLGTIYSFFTTDLWNTFRSIMYVRFFIANYLECLNPVSLPVTVLSKIKLSLKKRYNTTNTLGNLLTERILKSSF